MKVLNIIALILCTLHQNQATRVSDQKKGDYVPGTDPVWDAVNKYANAFKESSSGRPTMPGNSEVKIVKDDAWEAR